MKILYVSQYFPPEMGAPAARVSELSRAWTEAGHEVCVLTGFPNHPTGVVPPQYRGKIRERERWGDVEVLRTWIHAAANRGIARRSLAFLSFASSSVVLGALDRSVRGADVVVATSPQFLCAVSGWVLSRILRVPYVLEVRDLWPASIVEVGVLPPRHPVILTLEQVEQFLYRQAALLVSVTDSFCDVWKQQGIDPDKMRVIKNGVDLELFSPRPIDEAQKSALGLHGKFVVSYIGTHGMAQRLDTLLDAAQRLQDDPEIHVLLVGEGAERERLVARVEAQGLRNVTMLGQQPREAIPALVAASDLVAVILRRTELFEKVLPSKMFEIMGSGRPMVLGVRGEAERLLRDAGAGWAVTPEDPDALAEAIRRAKADPEECRRRGAAGRAFVCEHYDRDRLARRYLEELQTVVESR
ncbi:glycosyltransferase family 4 protein [Paraliomyxa miuraensis]|uniref:glycosyltransferase family 4 protein n=1 Tax=Paraliomyxa miuraensis TaxID=376150 RepID=UPI0022564960|nr:glycosyltransferase family 4 protein [Paraliomyxa miuraensis]MCX4242759.1 glycosyltransferase family 4 protein [Paraliomyxa miuraensis]